MNFCLDLHVHSHHSRDAKGSVLDLARAAKAAGLDGFALTDHDTVAGHTEIPTAAEETGLLIIPGMEVTSAEGHVLALGVQEPVSKGLGFAETLDAIEAQGGIAVVAHPLRPMSGMGPRGLEEHAAGRFFAVEAVNARDRRLVQQNTVRLAERLGLAMTGGSDVHWVQEMGTSWTLFDEPLGLVEDVLDAIRRGRCRGGGGSLARRKVIGHGLSLPLRALRRKLGKDV